MLLPDASAPLSNSAEALIARHDLDEDDEPLDDLGIALGDLIDPCELKPSLGPNALSSPESVPSSSDMENPCWGTLLMGSGVRCTPGFSSSTGHLCAHAGTTHKTRSDVMCICANAGPAVRDKRLWQHGPPTAPCAHPSW